MTALHPPRLSFAEGADTGAGLRLAYRQARANGHKPAAVVREYLQRWVWPECPVDMLGSDYPPEECKPGDVRVHTDRWARAGYCHGVLDALAGKPARGFSSKVTRERQDAYVSAYMAGRMAMTGVDA